MGWVSTALQIVWTYVRLYYSQSKPHNRRNEMRQPFDLHAQVTFARRDCPHGHGYGPWAMFVGQALTVPAKQRTQQLSSNESIKSHQRQKYEKEKCDSIPRLSLTTKIS